MSELSERLTDKVKIVMGCAPAALATTAGDGDWVSMKGYKKCTIVIAVLNATTVTGGAITVLQATAVAGTSAKAVSFATALRNIDCAAADALASFAVTSDTFTTDTTNSKQLLYVIDIDATQLDQANGFDCIRVDSASMASAVGCALYILHPMRYSTAPSAITD
jgi:hypothetical protein